MFLDEATIDVSGGAGGRGCVSWRREKYEPKGGPDGGDGGRGGDIVIIADANTDTLSDFTSRKRFEADKGHFGSGKNRHGRDGEDRILKVPPGTIIHDLSEDGSVRSVIADLRHDGDQVIAAQGGRGGYGNAHFVSSTRQRPDFAELGEPGEHRKLTLELKLVADVGIIGYPSVGKSTLISVISAARPKIAAYPFTTLIPNLGVVAVGDRTFVACDIPGLIEGASEGKGLGHEFLRHIERCGVLLHLLDLSRALGEGNSVNVQQLVDDYHAIRRELSAFSKTLAAKRELILLNKTDLVPEQVDAIVADLAHANIIIFKSISAATQGGTQELCEELLPIVLREREARQTIEADDAEPADTLPVLRPHETSPKMGAFRIEQSDDGSITIHGKRLEQFTVMTDFQSRGALERFRDVTERIGLLRALKRFKREDDTPIFIGKVRVEEYL